MEPDSLQLAADHYRSQQWREAEQLYRDHLAAHPNDAEVWNCLGNTLKMLGDLNAAGRAYESSLRYKPEFYEAAFNLGLIHHEQGNWKGAEAAYRLALEINPGLAPALNNLGCIFNQLADFPNAARCFDELVRLDPQSATAHLNLGNALASLGDHTAAIQSLRESYLIEPESAIGSLIRSMQHACAWDGLEALTHELLAMLSDDRLAKTTLGLAPFDLVGLPISVPPSIQLRHAVEWCRTFERSISLPAGTAYDWHRRERKQETFAEPCPGEGLTAPSRRLRIGYLSADFRVHAVGAMLAELFETHDRESFEIFGYSIGIDDESPIRQRIVGSFDVFRDLQNHPFVEAARAIADDGIDILVDLQGHTRGARTEILGLRPAPVQVAYLGFPGTMGADFIDYILVDDFIVPADRQPFFTEKLIHLPGCYQVNDSRLEIATTTPTRCECSLPKEAVVLSSFNASFKITPQVFDVWMDILSEAPDAVLWLADTNLSAANTWRRRAALRGIGKDRLILAPELPLAQHCARHRLADLSLDTFPYSGHATGSIALRMGVPVITLVGDSMASRVGGSLLRAVGLEDLITDSIDAYRELAIRLASDRDKLDKIRDQLSVGLAKTDLFSGKAFARKIERAFLWMWASKNR